MTVGDTPALTDYPAAVGVALGVVFTAILLFVSGRFDPTNGVLDALDPGGARLHWDCDGQSAVPDPRRRDERRGGWRADGGVRRDRGLLARPREGKLMSMLGLVLVIILILILLGGVGPSIYPGASWPYGYGLGHGGVGIIGIILIVILILALMGRL